MEQQRACTQITTQAAHARGREAEFTQVGGWDTSSDSYAGDSVVEESDEGDSAVEGSEEHFEENVAEEEDSTNGEDGSDEEVREARWLKCVMRTPWWGGHWGGGEGDCAGKRPGLGAQ